MGMTTTDVSLVKLLLAIEESQPVRGNDLIRLVTQRYSMSTHTYVPLRREAIVRRLINVEPSGRSGRGAFYSLTIEGEKYLEEHGDTATKVQKAKETSYFFNFGSMGHVKVTIKSLNSNEEIPIDTIQDLIVQHIMSEQLYHGGSPRINSKITLKISAKKVDKDIFRAIVHPLWQMERNNSQTGSSVSKEVIEKAIISDIEEYISKGGKKIRNWISWHLANVCELPEEVIDELYPLDENRPVDLDFEKRWFPKFTWEKLGFQPDSKYKYWGRLIFTALTDFIRAEFRFALHRAVRGNHLSSLYNLLVRYKYKTGKDFEDLTFLKLWDEIRGELLGPLPLDLKYIKGLSHLRKGVEEFPPLIKLVDQEIYKKWVIKGRPKINGTRDISKFLRFTIKNAWVGCSSLPLKSASLREACMKEAGELGFDFIKKNRFDIVEKSAS